MKRVAIPIVNQQLSEYFGECNHYEIFEIDKTILNKRVVHMPAGIAASDLPSWLENQGVTDVISYKVNKQIISLFASKKVNLFVGIPQKNTDSLIEDYLNGKLESDKKIIAEITD